MGGLLLRHLCIYLARSEQTEDHELLRRIRHCFLIASPISGSWVAKLLWWTGAPLLNKRVSYLAKPKVRGRGMAEAYRAAARLMDDLGIPRPKYSLFYGDSDRVVYHPKPSDITEDDNVEGLLPGDHNSLKLDQTRYSTLVSRINQILISHVRTSPVVQREIIQLQQESRAASHVHLRLGQTLIQPLTSYCYLAVPPKLTELANFTRPTTFLRDSSRTLLWSA